MKEILFEDGGALLSESPVYIEREADHQAIRHLQRMEYITLVEPRQQGKTSLISRLTGRMTPQGYVFAYADLTTFDRTSEIAWYGSFCSWLLRQAKFIPIADRPRLPSNGNTWRNFLCDVAEAAEKEKCNLVMALDEVGATPTAWATDFFSAIRSVYNSRQSMPCFRHLTFIVAGAFNPKELIRDRTISNFNVDHRIPLDDFSLDQVGQLVHHLGLVAGDTSVAERLHYWTNGQPFITQRLCRYLAEQSTSLASSSVDAIVERFFREDTNHLSRILSDLHAEPELFDYARNAIAKLIKFSPSVNDWQFRLSHVIGVIIPDQNGRCQIRNRIYEQALQLHEQPDRDRQPDPPNTRKKEAVGMDTPREYLEQLRKGNVVLFCGAGISVSDGGIPSGGQLARELADRSGLGDANSMTLPEVAQAYELEMGHQSLIAFIAERIGGGGRVPLHTHQLIAALPFERIITTNWDTLLEEALRQANKPVTRIVRDQDIAYVDEEKVTLIKLHGCIDQKDTIVVTGDDYYDVFARLPETANLARGFFATKTLLFLGYGLADEDFKRMYHEVERHLGKHKRRAYAVQLNPTALAVKYWQQKNVEVIAADATAFLEALRFAVDASSQVSPTAAGASPPESTTSSPGWTVEFAEAISSREHFEETLASRLPAGGLSLNSNMVVGASATLFAQWLGEYTRYVFGLVFPTEKGRYVLQGARPSLSFDTSTILTMDAHWVTSGKDEETEQAWPVSSLITFKIIPLGAERIELQAQCTQPAVSSYFRQLLQEIRDRWTVRELGQTGNSEPPRSKSDTATTGMPIPRGLNKDTNMDFERGLNAFRELAQGQDWYQDFIVHEAALRDNLRDERRYGPSEQTRRDRARIVDQLNALALTQLGASFNDLCMGKHAIPQSRTPPSDPEVVERLRRIEEKIDQGRAEDRESAEKILDALAQNRVAQADANKMMADLQTWAQGIQQAGLPLSPELRAAVDALTEHSGSAYQYLQVALPIIPGILTYNVEIGSQHQAVLKALWERMKARFCAMNPANG